MIDRRSLLRSLGSLLNAAVLYGATSASGVAREVGTEGSGGRISPERLLQAQLNLARSLIGKMARDTAAGSNVVVSPASLTAILALLDLGASSRMHTALHKCLGFAAADRKMSVNDFEGIRTVSADLTRRSQVAGPLTLANVLVFDPATRPSRLALLGLAAAGADVSVEDLDKPEAIHKINDWVKGKTKGLIPEVLGDSNRSWLSRDQRTSLQGSMEDSL